MRLAQMEHSSSATRGSSHADAVVEAQQQEALVRVGLCQKQRGPTNNPNPFADFSNLPHATSSTDPRCLDRWPRLYLPHSRTN